MSELETPDLPVPRHLDLELLLQGDAPMSAEARGLAHQAAVRLFDVDPDEVGLREPGSLLGPYRIERLLGCGGQALVYEATDTDLGRRVALKLPRPGVGERLLKEARAVGALSHPNVVRVEALREHDGQPYLVMELCTGGNLYDLLEGRPDGLPLDLVKRIGDQVLAALAHAHAQGVVHRDVKPGNVLFSEGAAKLGDFGIGKRTDEGAFEHSIDASHLTQGAVGTPLYMAPEQRDRGLLRGQPLDGRTDLYSFGRMLWTMVTGRTPDDYQPASRVRPELDSGWDELIWTLTERDRDRRPDDAEGVRGWLRSLPGDPLPPPPPVIPAQGSGPGSRAELLAPYRHGEPKQPSRRYRHRSPRWVFRLGCLGFLIASLLGFLTLTMTRATVAVDRGPQVVTVSDQQAVSPRYLRDAWATQTVRQARSSMRRGLPAAQIVIPLQPVVQRYPSYAEAWALLAEGYVRDGNFEGAQRAAERARSLDSARYGQQWFERRLSPWFDRVPNATPTPRVRRTTRPAVESPAPDPTDAPPPQVLPPGLGGRAQ